MTYRQRRQRKHGRRRGTASRGPLAILLGAVILLLGVGAVGAVGYVVSLASDVPSIDQLKPIDKGRTSVIYSADGKRLGFIAGDQLRTPIPGDEIPADALKATVAIEDKRFYQHDGVDYEGVARAVVANAVSGRNEQGGSTITMQLVRNLYISAERTFERKIREAKLAQELESEHSKKWILYRYLNSVPYGTVGGKTAVGIQAAARTFFAKPAKDLQLHEAALLAGLPQAPSLYNPFRDPQTALVRRNEVLDAMAQQKDITREQAAEAKQKPLGVKSNTFYSRQRESYFFDYVTQQLIDRYGVNTVRRGGLEITSTVRLNLQDAARKAIDGQLYLPDDPRSAIVTIDPKNGHIVAMASSADYSQSKFNLAAQGKRQPGSTFKVMVLMTALNRGVDPNSTTYTSKPLNFVDPNYGQIDVKTYSGGYGGRMNLVEATLQSDNTVYTQLDLDVGPDQVKKTAREMGIKTKLDGYPSEGLGGLRLGVSPLEMATAYATIANGGWRVTPTAIQKVKFPGGKVDDLGKSEKKKVFSDGVTAEATGILEKNVQSGTGTKAQLGCPAAGKTGTTDDFKDAWFVGFTPKLSTAVWVGYPNANIPMSSVHGISVNGGSFPTQIWHDYMAVAKGGDCSSFPEPKEPFLGKTFLAKYARSGGGKYDKYSDDTSIDTAPEKKKKKDSGGNNKKQYETPKQPDPEPKPAPKLPDPPKKTPEPEPTPAPKPQDGAQPAPTA